MGIVSSYRNHFRRTALDSKSMPTVCCISIQKVWTHIIPAKAFALVFMVGVS